MTEKKILDVVAKLEERLASLEQRRRTTREGNGRRETRQRTRTEPKLLCAQPDVPERPVDANVSPHRLELLRRHRQKWANGSVLRYYFFERDTAGNWVPLNWMAADAQKDVVREAFAEWYDLDIGLSFTEIDRPEDAEIKIGFEPGGSWSYVGRDALDYAAGASERTMNFGWDLTTDYGRDTALHEIGHALAFPHEHQSPNAGIVWNEAAVYAYFAGPPNFWDADKTRRNVIDKIPSVDVEGSQWDRDSIMHYSFEAGLIQHPTEYQTNPLIPASGLSDVDVEEVRSFYPPLKQRLPVLKPFDLERLDLGPGEQADFAIEPETTGWFDFRTFGMADTVMVLFEEDDDEYRFRTGDDDSGTGRNAAFRYKLVANRKYVLRIRLFWQDAHGQTAVLMW